MATLGNYTVEVDTTHAHKKLDAIIAKVQKAKAEMQSTGFIGGLFGFFNGRCTFFAILFSVVGIYLALIGKLTAEYVALVGSIQTLLVAHSVKEDMNDLRQAQVNVNVNTNPPVDPNAAH